MNDLKVIQLKEIAKHEGIKGYSKMNKASLIAAIKEARKDIATVDQKVTARKKVKKTYDNAMTKAKKSGYIVNNPCQANICNNFSYLFSNKVTFDGNGKTTSIPCISIPNISLKTDFLEVLENNQELYNLVPSECVQQFERFLTYLKNNDMCINCDACSKECYNNGLYSHYNTKAISDLRQLYLIINNLDVYKAEIITRAKNLKFVRFNASGEIHSSLILDLYIEIAKAVPDTTFYSYTKNYDLIKKYADKLPSNLIFNISDFENNINIDEYIHKFNIYKSVRTTPNEAKYTCKGDCLSCRQCFTLKNSIIHCKIHK